MASPLPRRGSRFALAACTVAASLAGAGSASAAITDAHLAFTGDTATTMAITFKEDAAVAGTSAIGYARPAVANNGGAAACATATPAPSDCIALPLSRTDAQGVATGTGPYYTFFTGTFTGLAPNKRYDWFVTTTATPAGLAPGTFTTAKDDDSTYTAATYGEVHVDDGDDVVPFGAAAPGQYTVQGVVGLNHANRVTLNQNVRPAFVVTSGDNMNDGTMETMYDRLLAGVYTFPNATQLDGTPTRQLLGSVPFMSALGDHEYKNTATPGTASPLYYAHFPNTGNGPTGQANRSYSYDYEGVHWVVLEASPGSKPSTYPAYWQHELEWLDADLKAAVPHTRFQVVVMHQPPFHSKTSRVYPEYADREFRDDIMPLMDKYGVEVVVSGHDAHNVRSHPVVGVPTEDWTADSGKPKVSPKIVGAGKGTTYLEQSTTGKNYDGLLDGEPWVAWSQDAATMPAVIFLTFGEETISGKFVRTDAIDPVYNTLMATGRPVDSFTIPRVDPAGAGTPVAGPKGDSGEKGDKGDAGATGANGAAGTAGATGPQGAAGRDGKDGTFTLSVAKATSSSVRRGHTATLAFTVKNGTTAASPAGTLAATVAKALHATGAKAVKVAALGAGRSRTVTVTLKVGRAATLGRHTIAVRLSIGGKAKTTSVKLRVRH